MDKETRKCKICKESIVLSDNSKEYFFEHKNSANICTHTKCYIKYHTTKKRNPKTVEECEEFINNCWEISKNIKKKKNIRNELYDFLFEMYDISYFPNYFYVKMDSIFKGTFKSIHKPVSPEDLLDMWKQKRNYLNKVAEQNRQKGTEITGINRIYYDLSILLSRYDAYLKWKEQQQIAVAEINTSKGNSIKKIEYSDVVRPVTVKHNNNAQIDISSMLDEI